MNTRLPLTHLLVGMLMLSTLAFAQTKRPPQARLEPQLRALIDSADSLPFEYRADIQLGIAEAGAIHNVKFETAMLERLFREASTAMYPLKQRDITGDGQKRPRKLGTAFNQNLDGLSVRLRVVRRFLKIKPDAARTYFEELRVEIPPSACKSPMVYDAGEYYRTAAEVLKADGSPSGPRRDELLQQLQGLARSVSSPVQLVPLLSLISESDLPDERVQAVLPDISVVLRSIAVSNREFSAIEADHSLTRAMQAIASGHKGPAANELLTAYRSFLVRGATSPRCSENKMSPQSIAESFNGLLREAGAESAVPLLNTQDVTPEREGDATSAESIPDFSEFNGLLKRLLILRRTGPDAPEAQGWESDVSTFLDRVHAVGDSSTCHTCVFHKKADLFMTFLDFTPKSSLKQRIVADYVQFLANDAAKDEAPLEWLFRVKMLVNQVRTPSQDSLDRIAELKGSGRILTGLPSDVAAEIMTAIRNSNNPVLIQLLVADSILKRSYELPPYMARTPERDGGTKVTRE